ncbi:MAG TPA: 6-carboxytetrahydropterin synthase [Bryobacteraceae bacterium]|jgi:6-pyruvoyltetrahydropterin/6-carboxytetrahydropterin synthase|nr:6-carboxytetrahydropterin synthase [Bryobacteraceae bacterium]
MITVTRRYEFPASHRLHAPGLSDEENRRLYGKCNNPFGHGHNYVLEISVRGPVEERSGRAVDPAALDSLVRERVIRLFDHKNLNDEVDEFRRVVPTTENFGLLIRRLLKQEWSSVFPGPWPRLKKVRIAETARNIFEVNEDNESGNHGQ